MTDGKVFACMDRLLDRGAIGPLHLKREEVARVVGESIHDGAGRDFDLHAWVLMANHVHLLLTPLADFAQLMQRIKGRSAKLCNDLLGLRGEPFWHHESYDRCVRSAEEYRRVARYIECNPVKAGLVDDPKAFRWSSAWGGLKSAAS